MVSFRSSNAIVVAFAAQGVFGASLPRRTLGENDIIAYGANGRVEVMDKATYFAATNISLHAPPLSFVPVTITNSTSYSNSTAGNSTIAKRCKSETIFTMNPDRMFLNWDVPMSSVVQAGDVPATVSVTPGYSISNSLSVSAEVHFGIIQEMLDLTYGIDYSQTWGTSYTAGYTFTVPVGKYGAVVSNPAAIRKTGFVDVGCIGIAERSEFSSDTYKSKAYGGLSWVDGTISLCTGDSYPLNMCNGDGTIA